MSREKYLQKLHYMYGNVNLSEGTVSLFQNTT